MLAHAVFQGFTCRNFFNMPEFQFHPRLNFFIQNGMFRAKNEQTACWILNSMLKIRHVKIGIRHVENRYVYCMLKTVKAAWWNQRRPNSRFKCVYYVLKRVYSIWCIIVMVLMPSIIDCFRPLKKESFWSTAQACACAALKTELCIYFRHACAKLLVYH